MEKNSTSHPNEGHGDLTAIDLRSLEGEPNPPPSPPSPQPSLTEGPEPPNSLHVGHKPSLWNLLQQAPPDSRQRRRAFTLPRGCDPCPNAPPEAFPSRDVLTFAQLCDAHLQHPPPSSVHVTTRYCWCNQTRQPSHNPGPAVDTNHDGLSDHSESQEELGEDDTEEELDEGAQRPPATTLDNSHPLSPQGLAVDSGESRSHSSDEGQPVQQRPGCHRGQTPDPSPRRPSYMLYPCDTLHALRRMASCQDVDARAHMPTTL